jgi:hypothetical protein
VKEQRQGWDAHGRPGRWADGLRRRTGRSKLNALNRLRSEQSVSACLEVGGKTSNIIFKFSERSVFQSIKIMCLLLVCCAFEKRIQFP